MKSFVPEKYHRVNHRYVTLHTDTTLEQWDRNEDKNKSIETNLIKNEVACEEPCEVEDSFQGKDDQRCGQVEIEEL